VNNHQINQEEVALITGGYNAKEILTGNTMQND
jgi:hypothetical protein